MGFGLLLIGYVTAYLFKIGMGDYGFAATLVGGFLIVLALSKLKEYQKFFKIAFFCAMPLLAFATVESVWAVNKIFADMLGAGLPLPEMPDGVFDGIRYFCELLQTVTMLIGISAIAKEVDLPAYSSKARADIALVGFEYLYSAVFLVLQVFVENLNTEFLLKLELLIDLVTVALIVYLLIRCYMYICDEKDKDMTAKPSKFAFVNKLRAKREAQMERTRAEAEEYAKSRLDKKKKKKK